MFDIVIVGAGIIGTMLAKDLAAYHLKVAVLEKENDVACGATMANSAIVHTGYDPEEGTLKALLNVRGARLYPQLCKDIDCEYKQVGAYIAAVGEEEEKHLKELADRAEQRGIQYEWLSGDEARNEENNLNDAVTRVLSFPETAVIYPWMVAIGCMEVAMQNGCELHLNTPVTSIHKTDDGYLVYSEEQTFHTKAVINCAGVFADHIYGMVSEDPGFEITPRKGEYFVLDNDVQYVKHIIYPVPSSKGKGVLAVPTVHGNTLLGPNSDAQESRDDVGTSFSGLEYDRENLNKILKNVPFRHTIRHFAGLRPTSTRKDFIIEEAKENPGFINVAGIESPGIASAPGISQYVIDEILSRIFKLEPNEKAVLTRQAPLRMMELSEEERNDKIRENPAYGRIICRCQQVSEGEIVDAIHERCGAHTVKGVKKRVNAGFGRCQGGFCEPRVLEILARELHVSPTEILQDRPGSNILKEENR